MVEIVGKADVMYVTGLFNVSSLFTFSKILSRENFLVALFLGQGSV